MNLRQPVLIYGSRILAGLARDMVEASAQTEFAGYIDDVLEGPDIVGGLAKVASDPELRRAFVCPALGDSDLALRWRVIEGVRGQGMRLMTLRHPGDYLGRDAHLGEGGIFLPGSHIDRECHLGVGVVLWPRATINHHCEIGDNVFVCSGATVCGCAVIGPHSFIGAGATVVDEARIGHHCFVGAGVLVHGDLPDGSRIVARPNYIPHLMDTWQIDHVARVVADLPAYLERSFVPAPGPTVYDPAQDADICFVDLGEGQPRLELIQPRSPESRVYRAAQGQPDALHHVCYRVSDVAEAQDRIRRYQMVPIFGPVPAVALGGEPVLFAYSRNREIVEFVCGRSGSATRLRGAS